MSIIEILKVIVLGIVEGFTEWLPISSTGHMLLVDEIIQLNVTKEYYSLFEVVIQLGAIMAVVVLYFRKLNPFDRGKSQNQQMATIRLWLKIIIACVPAAVVGLLFDDWIDAHLKSPWIIAIALIVYGVWFIILEDQHKYKTYSVERTSQITGQTALYIGLFQLLSLVPGTSRSGVTIIGAMILGCSRTVAAEFTFFLGIPVMFGASLLRIVKYFVKGYSFTFPEFFYLILGMAVAFVVSVYSIKFLMGYVKKNDFRFFGYYRIVLGVVVIAYFGVTALTG